MTTINPVGQKVWGLATGDEAGAVVATAVPSSVDLVSRLKAERAEADEHAWCTTISQPYQQHVQDERFQHYCDVSPCGSASSSNEGDQDEAYFAVDDDSVMEMEAACMVKCAPQSSDRFAVSDQLETFVPLVVSSAEQQKQSGLQDERHYHHHAQPPYYGNMNTSMEMARVLDVGMMGESSCKPVLSVNMVTSAGLHITLARSALNRLSQDGNQGGYTADSLECAALRHRCDALATTQRLTQSARQPEHLDELLESLIEQEQMDRSTGVDVASSANYMRLRELIKSIGGPLNIRSCRVSRMLAHFECLYGSFNQSYIWGEINFLEALTETNDCFSRIWTTWRGLIQRFTFVKDEMKNILGQDPRWNCMPSIVRNGSVLKNILTETVEDQYGLSAIDRSETLCQLATLFTLCMTILDQQENSPQAQQYMDQLHQEVESIPKQDQSRKRLMWLFQTYDQSDQHARRIWTATKIVWLLRRVTYNVQATQPEFGNPRVSQKWEEIVLVVLNRTMVMLKELFWPAEAGDSRVLCLHVRLNIPIATFLARENDQASLVTSPAKQIKSRNAYKTSRTTLNNGYSWNVARASHGPGRERCNEDWANEEIMDDLKTIHRIEGCSDAHDR